MASAMTRYFLLPILLGLHALFLAYALAKRILHTFTPVKPRILKAKASTPPPRHLALIIVPGSSRKKPLSLIQQDADDGVFVQSVEMALDFCAERGVKELSVWDTGRGLTQQCINRLEWSVRASDLSQNQKHQSGTHSPWRLCERRAEDDDKVETWHVEVEAGLKARKVVVHFLPPAASSAYVASLARRVAPLDERALDKAIQSELHYANDPDLLLIHHMRPGVGLRRSAPELYGFPFWPLRITEIYQHPSPLFSLWRKGSDTEPLRIAALEGAMTAFGRVEQRLGR